MKKYVRTKDGHLFEVKKDLGKYGCSTAVLICDFDGNMIDLSQQSNIFKEADSVEELCDLYCMIEKKYPQHNYMLKYVDIPLEDRHEYDIYAMVKTTDEHDAPIIKSAAKWSEKGWILI